MTDTRETAPVSHVRFNWTVISIVAALLTQSGVLISWAAKLDQRVEVLETKVEASAGVAEAVARIDERSYATRASIERIEARLAADDARRGGR